MTNEIIFDTSSPTASITFNRPDKANAMLVEWPDMMHRFFQQVSTDSKVRCIVIKANGKNFVAGGDLEQFNDAISMNDSDRASRIESDVYSWNKMIQAMMRCPQPIICQVQGAVAGAAVGLVAACDLIVTSKSAYFFLAHILSGMSNDGLATYFLPRQIGVHRTLQLALLGERISAEQAQQLGMVNYVVENDALAGETDKLVQRLVTGPTVAYANIKKLVRSSLQNSIEQQGAMEAEYMAEAVQTHDWKEGISAFTEKRKPAFKGQ